MHHPVVPASPHPPPETCNTWTIEQRTAHCKHIANEWESGSDALPSGSTVVVPDIGLPSHPLSNGVCTLMHSVAGMPPLKINGHTCKSPALCNMGLYSFECTPDGHWLHLYENLFVDTPGHDLMPSSGQWYVNQLHANGLDVAGVHFHWTGTGQPIMAVHHQNIGLAPAAFTAKTLGSLHEYLRHQFPSPPV